MQDGPPEALELVALHTYALSEAPRPLNLQRDSKRKSVENNLKLSVCYWKRYAKRPVFGP
jgi:hypothetical protein